MNVLRTSFLVATDVLMVLMLVSLLAACGGAPTRYRNGDFISNMASAASASGNQPAARPGAALPVAVNSRAGTAPPDAV